MKNEDMGVLSWGEEIQNSEMWVGKESSKVLKKIAEN